MNIEEIAIGNYFHIKTDNGLLDTIFRVCMIDLSTNSVDIVGDNDELFTVNVSHLVPIGIALDTCKCKDLVSYKYDEFDNNFKLTFKSLLFNITIDYVSPVNTGHVIYVNNIQNLYKNITGFILKIDLK